ncbi:DUF6344 domain-containing protein [Streptomyces sp. DH24]|uniref:DUF6344 domain-containing protein n=1 Tax=Streptomyces sp. DH24 TaxID=3040123 RepID=UPI00244305C6|nr:DUF6344 domain-containing protein [Streptomyces sp. DH24]MDG9718632.1 DUF6344 domain-containing protein [Streptomyces sp. DH24]
MARTKVMKLWTAIVTAFLALFAALGLATTNASAAVQQTETSRNSDSEHGTDRSALQPAARTTSPWIHAGALPPTMKQRIRAEAHGKSPSCRHRPEASAAATSSCTPGTASEEPLAREIPLQR